jgi:hypothetical protein
LTRYRQLASAVLFIALTLSIGCKRDSEQESATKKRVDPAVVTRTAEGDPLIRMDQATRRLIGIEVASVTPASLQPQIIAYGRLEEDPSRSFVVRAPVAGTVQTPAGGAGWPSAGETLTAGQEVGLIEPRIAPAEQIALTTQLTGARSDADSATAAAEASQAAYERARVLNADDKNVSDRVLEEARARLEAERARLNSARTTIRTLENALRVSGPAAYRLAVNAGGTVVETMARPGESVEAGLPLLRISRLDRLVARVDLPVGQNLPQSAMLARIVPAAHESEVIPADRIAATSVIDPKSPGESFLFRLREGRFGLRPGLAVTAYLPQPGPSKQGFTIPPAAVVRLSGKAYVYLQTAAGSFVRREIKVESPVASGYFVTGRLAASDYIVITGAQTLLSEEFKPASVQEE